MNADASRLLATAARSLTPRAEMDSRTSPE
jgi:hypothetical protein